MTNPTTSKARLFIGVKVSVATVNALAEAVSALDKRAAAAGTKIRWVAPATYHITLKFIGWTRGEAVDAIRDRVERQLRGVRAFAFTTKGMGAFPKPERARVVWAGIDNPGRELVKLASRVDEATADLGYPSEQRPFHPHVTLGRLREPANVVSLLEPVSDTLFSETFAESVILYESIMKSSGSEYFQRHCWLLESDSNRAKRHTD